MRVLRYTRHWCLRCPFVCIEVAPGRAEIVEPRPCSKAAARLQISVGDHSGREELHPDEWSPRVERMWAKYVRKVLVG